VGRTARRSVLILVAAILLVGCATATPTRPRTSEASEAPRRCSTADPDRWAWFCVVGQILYGAASFFTPVNELTMR
jgi:outer membrane biogenesis lipoprotein LolB